MSCSRINHTLSFCWGKIEKKIVNWKQIFSLKVKTSDHTWLNSEYRSSHSQRSSFFNSEEVATANASVSASTQRRRPSASGASTGSSINTTPPSRGSSQSFLGLAALQSRSQNLQKKDSISSTESLSPSPSESRGTPDGCGLDLVNSSPELLTKKGWLMKQGLTKEWHKYW